MSNDPGPLPLDVVELNGRRELAEVLRVFDEIWGRSAEPQLSMEILTVLALEGGYISGVRGDDGRLIAASVGIFGRSAAGEWLLHSHVTGALPPARRRHAGLLLKAHQRSWCLERAITTVQWTFDPLVRRNAYFNLAKLAADAVAYLPDFYGEMTDRLNAGQPSDRLLISWDLGSDTVAAAVAGRPRPTIQRPDAVAALSVGADGSARWYPVPGEAVAALVATPPDVESLRDADPGAARAWRAAQAGVLTDLMGRGWVIDGFVDRACYLLVAPGRDPARVGRRPGANPGRG